MNPNRYFLKLALGAAIAFAVGHTIHSGRIIYVLFGALLCIHPIAGDTVGLVRDKLTSTALGAGCGLLLDVAFQGNPTATLAVGPPLLLTGGYWFGVPKQVLNFSIIVLILAVSASYSAEPFEYIGLRFWNIFVGSLVGIAVNIALWPDTDTDKLAPALAQGIASIRALYDQTINDYRQGQLAANVQARQQLRTSIEGQLNAITSLLGNAKNELWLPFTNDATYQRWVALQTPVNALFLQVANLGLALEGGDDDRLFQVVQPELVTLIQSTREAFDHFSHTSAFQANQPLADLLANLPDLNAAIRDRLSQIDTSDLPTDLDPDEVKRLAAAIYGLEKIASELGALTEVMAASFSAV
jgi:uncharacterized membrane protein YccC